MVFNRKQKKLGKQRISKKQYSKDINMRKSKRAGVLQYGGVSPACVLNNATSADILYRNPAVNIHNTNPQASLDLDNKFMSYGSSVPLGNNILQGGAAKCGDEGLGGAGNGKNETFKQYLNGLEKKYMVGGFNNSNTPEYQKNLEPKQQMIPNTKKSELIRSLPPPVMNADGMDMSNAPRAMSNAPRAMNVDGMAMGNAPRDMNADGMGNAPEDMNADDMGSASMQSAGGFTTDPSEYIAGLPVYKAYDDCCPPAIINNKLIMGAPDKPVCGLGAIKGGSRRYSKRASSRKHKHTSRKYKSSRVSKAKHSSNKRHSRNQKGGAMNDFVYSSTKSKPAPMTDAFNGPQGIFRYPDNMMSRNFGEVQPNYSVNAI